MPVREYLALVQEVSLGTPVGSPSTGTTRIYPRLTTPYQGLMKPTIGIIPNGNGYGGPGCFYSDGSGFTGSIQGELYPAQTNFLMGWATTRIPSARDKPWTTTDSAGVMPLYDLASVSAYHGVLEASTMKRRRGSGLKVSNFTLSASRSDPIWKYNAATIGIRDDTNAAGTVADPLIDEIPDPTDAAYPCGPWLFSHLAGGLKIASSRTMFDSVSVTFANTLADRAFESRYAQTIQLFARTITIEVSLYRKPSPDDLASYRALTAMDVQLVLANGTNTLTMDFGDYCRWTNLDEDLPMDSTYGWKGTITAGWDATAGTDFLYTYA